MFHKLKRRLVLLYGVTTSIILTLIVCGVFLILHKQSREQNQVLFKKNVEQIAEKIRTENIISNSWLIKIQEESDLLIFIEDSGKLLTNYNRIDQNVNTLEMIIKLKELALVEGINLNQKPLFSSTEKTSIYQIQQDRTRYLGMAMLIARDTGWLNVMAIYYDANSNNQLLQLLFLFFFIDLIGVAALFLISNLYIGNVLRPLEEGKREQTTFIASASHELRSPLTVIKAGISSMKGDNSKIDQFLPHIERECDRMSRLISDMLLLASTDAGNWSLEKEPVDMDTLLIESYDTYSILCSERNCKLYINLPQEPLHKMNGDKERLKQVVAILLDNAMTHTPLGGHITIYAYNRKRSVEVEVEDHGLGIPDGEKMHIFERFYRGDKSRNEKNHYGLGLSIARELIELHGGVITVKDTEGGGATFVLNLPFHT